MSTTRELPAPLFDKLAEVVKAAGGVGVGSYHTGGAPCCIHGCAFDAALALGIDTSEAVRILNSIGLTIGVNDLVVSAHLNKWHLSSSDRMPWGTYCLTTGLARGPDE